MLCLQKEQEHLAFPTTFRTEKQSFILQVDRIGSLGLLHMKHRKSESMFESVLTAYFVHLLCYKKHHKDKAHKAEGSSVNSFSLFTAPEKKHEE